MLDIHASFQNKVFNSSTVNILEEPLSHFIINRCPFCIQPAYGKALTVKGPSICFVCDNGIVCTCSTRIKSNRRPVFILIEYDIITQLYIERSTACIDKVAESCQTVLVRDDPRIACKGKRPLGCINLVSIIAFRYLIDIFTCSFFPPSCENIAWLSRRSWRSWQCYLCIWIVAIRIRAAASPPFAIYNILDCVRVHIIPVRCKGFATCITVGDFSLFLRHCFAIIRPAGKALRRSPGLKQRNSIFNSIAGGVFVYAVFRNIIIGDVISNDLPLCSKRLSFCHCSCFRTPTLELIAFSCRIRRLDAAERSAIGDIVLNIIDNTVIIYKGNGIFLRFPLCIIGSCAFPCLCTGDRCLDCSAEVFSKIPSSKYVSGFCDIRCSRKYRLLVIGMHSGSITGQCSAVQFQTKAVLICLPGSSKSHIFCRHSVNGIWIAILQPAIEAVAGASWIGRRCYR